MGSVCTPARPDASEKAKCCISSCSRSRAHRSRQWLGCASLRLRCVRALDPLLPTNAAAPFGGMSAGLDAVADAEALCVQIQAGSAPPSLSSALSTSSGARAFFATYLTGEAWSCADDDQPPAILIDAIQGATTQHWRSAHEFVTSAAAGSEPMQSRACSLVTALWKDVPQLRLASSALQDAVAFRGGAPVKAAFDQNYEYMVEEWLGILNFSSYDAEQLARVREALASCATPSAD